MGNKQFSKENIFKDSSAEQELQDSGPNTLLIKAFTWLKDSQGLYDYENENITKSVLKVDVSGIVHRKDESIFFINRKQNILESSYQNPLKEILSITRQGNNYFITGSARPQQRYYQNETDLIGENSLWIVVKSLKYVKGSKFGYYLNVDDVIKLGRVRFRIKEIVLQKDVNKNVKQPKQSEKYLKEQQIKQANKNLNNQTEEDQELIHKLGEDSICRICLSDQYTEKNPLVSPCLCSGSMKFVHIQCLQYWLKNKVANKSSDYSSIFIWRNLSCELCKTSFQMKLNINGVQYDTVEIPRPEPPYILMDILSKERNISRGIQIISMNGRSEITIGRGSDQDVRIQDISVSRSHAAFIFNKGNFYLDDKGSKFGTLALVRNKIEISSQKIDKIGLQVNRTVFTFNLKKEKTLLEGCCASKKKKTIHQTTLEKQIQIEKKIIFNQEENRQDALSEIIRPYNQISHLQQQQLHLQQLYANQNFIQNHLQQINQNYQDEDIPNEWNNRDNQIDQLNYIEPNNNQNDDEDIGQENEIELEVQNNQREPQDDQDEINSNDSNSSVEEEEAISQQMNIFNMHSNDLRFHNTRIRQQQYRNQNEQDLVQQ